VKGEFTNPVAAGAEKRKKIGVLDTQERKKRTACVIQSDREKKKRQIGQEEKKAGRGKKGRGIAAAAPTKRLKKEERSPLMNAARKEEGL